MKLINHTLLILSTILFTTVGLWAFLFFFQLFDQVKNTIDEGLSNHKIAIIDNLINENSIADQISFQDKSYSIKNINETYALQIRDTYTDTLIFSNLKNSNYEARLLTTAFVASDGNYYELKVLSHEINKGNLIEKIITSLLWLFLFLIISTLFVNRFVLKNTWKPFYEILNFLNDFRIDKKVPQELTKTNIKEFNLLNKSVKNLLNKNVEIFNSQKQFIENASHELQTPLAIGINKLELLAEEPSLSPEQINKIGQITESFQRLSGLNKSLLLLSKIENQQFNLTEEVNFNKLISRVIRDFSDFTAHQNIKITHLQEGDWIVKINKSLAEMLVLNLIKNAIVHNQKDGEIIIQSTSSSFMIKNQSELKEIPSDKIFMRFNKNSNQKNSTGLGLAIVKSITEVSNLVITYYYNGRHVFKVSEI
ncbi:HAMP domain-containing histidine kinase [Aurantibacter crassamenti]|uniref:sensor histidine kinase n=1 Tax=Aurantibacter crassamenti TaxID=1837375 RepID=UPI001939A8AE|nr:HAMP domain-containing sensor histidine kinase [Aurantibacter crassamenti]MBM1105849.1 HAMP domain-containing histidine kinase [Aurantibacter crassamenti]